MDDLARRLHDDAPLAAVPFAAALIDVVTAPAGTSSAGFPFLGQAAYERLRDTVPHVLGMGPLALQALTAIGEAADRLSGDDDEAARENVARASSVVRTVLNTAAITAPSDLWLLRHVLGALHQGGVLGRLLAGEAVDPVACDVVVDGAGRRADPGELTTDLTLLLARGLLAERGDGAFVMAPHPRARAVLQSATPVPSPEPAGVSSTWTRVFRDEPLQPGDAAAVASLGTGLRPRSDLEQDTWLPTWAEIDVGYRLLPVVLGLRAAGKHDDAGKAPVTAALLSRAHADLAAVAVRVLHAAGVIDDEGHATLTGKRVLDKGAGPMGIIEAYHPYMTRLLAIMTQGRGAAWVSRGSNIAASQDANRATFEKANDALDAFCAQRGFTYGVFIEHAIGRGEATRQRFGKSGDDAIRYFGADLEDAAIDAAILEQQAGRLPRGMEFIRQADIGDPGRLVAALRAAGVATEGAVMIVGNGFHEVRGQTDEKMVEVFRGYHGAGIVLLFTEESALSVDDLLATAWNTYHAGFKYVHEKSGQGLRPADEGPPHRAGRPLRASWNACATRAGYVRVDTHSTRSRTIYPTAPPRRGTAHNPTVSVNHFFIPRGLAERLALLETAPPVDG